MDVLLKRYPNIHLLIVGEGDEKESLQNLTQGLGINKAVTFLGFVPREKAPEVYGQADIYVSPSFNEGMANFMLECMALGMPIVATDVGGTRELMVENENGFIIKTGDYNDIVEKLEKFLLDRSLVDRLGKQSRIRAEKMSWQKVAGEYVDLYQEVRNINKMNGA